MLECQYPAEPVDFRLLLLRLWKQGYKIVLAALLGTVLFGGGYYLKEVVLPPPEYVATSLYQVEYVLDPVSESEYTFINGDTWNQWMDTKEFLDLLYKNLEGTSEAEIDRDTMKEYVSASLQMDLRMPDTSVTTGDPQLSLRIAGAVERSMVDFAAGQKGIDNIRVVDPASEAPRSSVARPLNACILAAAVSFFLSVIAAALKELGEDSIWLPAVLGRRYGLKVLGTGESGWFEENVSWLLKGCRKVGVLPVGLESVPKEAMEALGKAAGSSVELEQLQLFGKKDINQEIDKETGKETVGAFRVEIGLGSRIRKLDGLVLAVKAGPHTGKKLEEVLDNLKVQDCTVTAAMLVQADEQLIRRYYWKENLVQKTGRNRRSSK